MSDAPSGDPLDETFKHARLFVIALADARAARRAKNETTFDAALTRARDAMKAIYDHMSEYLTTSMQRGKRW